MKKNQCLRVSRATAVLLLTVFTFSCVRLPKDLTLEEKQFMDYASIIMSPAERKAFSSIPPEQRGEFIEDFWKRRDPDPSTEANEFKLEYYNRIGEANRLFKEGGRAGWATDRGRYYVMLGVPDRRDVYPSGYTFYAPPVEIWFYGFFTIVFIDQYRESIFRLEPSSAWQISQIQNAQLLLNQGMPMAGVKPDDKKFDFVMQLKKEMGGATLQFLVPVKTIAFSENTQKKIHEALLRIQVVIYNTKNKEKVTNQTKDYPLSITPEQLEKLPNFLVLEMTFALEAGEYQAAVILENTVDNAKVEKRFDFHI